MACEWKAELILGLDVTAVVEDVEGVLVITTAEGIGRVPHVRRSVRGPKTMGAAQRSLLLNDHAHTSPVLTD
jgi:hypothetical protein